MSEDVSKRVWDDSSHFRRLCLSLHCECLPCPCLTIGKYRPCTYTHQWSSFYMFTHSHHCIPPAQSQQWVELSHCRSPSAESLVQTLSQNKRSSSAPLVSRTPQRRWAGSAPPPPAHHPPSPPHYAPPPSLTSSVADSELPPVHYLFLPQTFTPVDGSQVCLSGAVATSCSI